MSKEIMFKKLPYAVLDYTKLRAIAFPPTVILSLQVFTNSADLWL